MIQCASPFMQYKPLESEIQSAIVAVLDSGHYILGPQVSAFEKEFADYLGVPHAIGCGSGTDALVLALYVNNIGVGDEVIVPSHTATATVAAVVMSGATPVFADIEADFYTLDVHAVEASCTPRTKAVIAVHLYGQPANIDGILAVARARNLLVIEDCAQAVGSTSKGRKLGTIGDLGCYSFFPTKNLGAIGDAGAVVCHDNEIAERIMRIRQYGWDKDRISVEAGMNSRLDELQAAILRVKLPHLDAANAERAMQAERYRASLSDLPIGLPLVRIGAMHSYHLFVLRVQSVERDCLIAHLAKQGVGCGIHYAIPAHKMPAFGSSAVLPVTEAISSEILSLPLFPGLDAHQQNDVISGIRSFYGR
jgi:dTDP-4-amino-4,6-dideoxygalactose transaminase